MRDYVILADSACDLGEAYQREYDIHVVHGHIALPNGEQVSTLLKWEQWTREEFYADLKKHPNDYSTSPANPNEFAAAFESFAKQGKDIIVITISSGISGTYNNTIMAARAINESYPNINIACVDSLRFGPAMGLLCIKAAMLKKEGKSFDETVSYLEANKNRYHQAGWLDDLSFVAKKGRLTHAKAFFGTLAGVKPIGEFDYNGLTTVLGKAKNAATAYNVLLDYIDKTIEQPQEQIIFIAQTNRLPQAELYKKMIEERFHPKAVYINDVFPYCGVSIGPGLMAAYYMGKPISKDLSVERGIIEELLAR